MAKIRKFELIKIIASKYREKKRQRADAYHYALLNNKTRDKGTQQIIQGGREIQSRSPNGSRTSNKNVLKCVSVPCPLPTPSLAMHPLRNRLKRQSTSPPRNRDAKGDHLTGTDDAAV